MTREQVYEVIGLARALRREAGERSASISVHRCTAEELAFAVEAGGERRSVTTPVGRTIVWAEVHGANGSLPDVEFFLEEPALADADMQVLAERIFVAEDDL